MYMYEIGKSSKAQDSTIMLPLQLFKKMQRIGYLETSKHEIRILETDTEASVYAFDAAQMISSKNNKPITSCYIQLHKQLTTYQNQNLQETIFAIAPQINWCYTNSTYKNQNIGFEMYSFLVMRYGSIWSDIKHSRGATKLWIQIANAFDVSLVDFEEGGKIIKEITKDPIKDGWYDKKSYLLLARAG